MIDRFVHADVFTLTGDDYRSRQPAGSSAKAAPHKTESPRHVREPGTHHALGWAEPRR